MITLSIFLAASAASALPADTASNDDFGSISGKVTWEGDRPDPKPDLEYKEEATVGCKHGGEGLAKNDESLLISDAGGVANVVMTIEASGEAQIPTEPVVFDQEGCRFHPHVAVVPVGATLRFLNSDETNHNIHTYAKKNQPINKNVAAEGTLDQVLEKAEVIDIKCDIHPWMKGYVEVTDATHWATTSADGSFKLTGVPPGEYEISWWHEELGKGKTEKVTVEAGKEASIEHMVGAKKKKSGGRRR